MAKHTLISIDLAKSVFQVCGVTKNRNIVFNKQLKRLELAEFMVNQEACVVAMEACYSSHYWARIFESMGHTIKLLPAQHVTPFVRGNKSDHNDAIAISEAALRPNIKAVPVKTVEQQDIQSLHRIRERHVSHRTGLMNQTRGLLSEYGVIAPLGHKSYCKLLREITDPCCDIVTPLLKHELGQILDEYYAHCERISEINSKLTKIAKNNPYCQILLSIPGIGVINATAIYSAIGDGSQFANAREFAVWLGLTPKTSSSGQSFKSGGITKRGNSYLRKQLVHGARAILTSGRKKTDRLSAWGNQLMARRGYPKACVAMAARLARLGWVLLQKMETYRAVEAH